VVIKVYPSINVTLPIQIHAFT